MDMIAQILTFGNIHAESKVLLVETCQGLLAGAIVDRLSGTRLLNLIYSSHSHRLIFLPVASRYLTIIVHPC